MAITMILHVVRRTIRRRRQADRCAPRQRRPPATRPALPPACASHGKRTVALVPMPVRSRSAVLPRSRPPAAGSAPARHPCPRTGRECCRPPRQNGRPTSDSTSSGIPSPVSVTVTATAPSEGITATFTEPPGGVNFTALSSRFSTMRRAAQASPVSGSNPSAMSVTTVTCPSSAWSRTSSTARRSTAPRSTGSERGTCSSNLVRSTRLLIVANSRRLAICTTPSGSRWFGRQSALMSCVSPMIACSGARRS